MLQDWIPELPLAEWIDKVVGWAEDNLKFIFDPITKGLEVTTDGLIEFLNWMPAWLLIIILMAIAFFAGKKRGIGLPIFILVGGLLIISIGYWEQMLSTLALVLITTIISVIIGIPVGILMAASAQTQRVLVPVLDFMQTMPAFVYLIPAVTFFGIGMVPGVVASVIFAMPPTVRLTNLGIRGVSTELIEASDAFGSSGLQKLYKVQLPMARPTIMAGVNQTIMLALSMVVIAAMIGAKGLGPEVFKAVTQNQAGVGFASGLAIVILAIILDRITQKFNAAKR
ncbi:ABC transporter permease [Aureibacillus halotolerans]|uniref:Glycine betaine/proline transport system permease protein n=1 Tax=Aureibacillus halotolerans TaxID=1508390 RepID=A0A4R6TYT0_9BACI|nr:proline/glycine betaine ABC transporter permease [Aureibacillus halotolerans]TDQ35385.1 glycine betaine/proline transport system permease protein [Aureibacillus halotolerans]